MENTVKRVLLRSMAEELNTEQIKMVSGGWKNPLYDTDNPKPEGTWYDTNGNACDAD